MINSKLHFYPVAIAASLVMPLSQAQEYNLRPSHIYNLTDGSRTYRYDIPGTPYESSQTIFRHQSAQDISRQERMELFTQGGLLLLVIAGAVADAFNNPNPAPYTAQPQKSHTYPSPSSEKAPESESKPLLSNEYNRRIVDFSIKRDEEWAKEVLSLTPEAPDQRAKVVQVHPSFDVLKKEHGSDLIDGMAYGLSQRLDFPSETDIGGQYYDLKGVTLGAEGLLILDKGVAVFGHYVGDDGHPELKKGDWILSVDGQPFTPFRGLQDTLNSGSDELIRRMIVVQNGGRTYTKYVELERQTMSKENFERMRDYLVARRVGAALALQEHSDSIKEFAWKASE